MDTILKNRLFQTNWLCLLVRSSLSSSENDAFFYDGVLMSGVGDMASLMRGSWRFQCIERTDGGKFQLLLPSAEGVQVALDLPRGEDVVRVELARDPEVDSLLQSRDELLGALQGYTLRNEVDGPTAAAIRELTVLHRVA